MSTPPLYFPSFAKINWSLHVLGRRTDGYHEIRTLLQTISLHDDLWFSASDDQDLTLFCPQPDIPLGGDNLVIQAAELLRERCSVSAGAKIRLEKRIPAKGGLGGGSSNAAIALLGLNRLWQLQLGVEELHDLASRLGADVPFFLFGGRALANGTGSDVTPVDDTELRHLIIVTPRTTVATAYAYALLKATALTTSSDDIILSDFRGASDLTLSRLCAPHNDFERVIFEAEPEIARAKYALAHAGAASALMAGSGSSVFGIFESTDDQQRALNQLQAEPGWRVFPAVTVSRAEYMREIGSSEESRLKI